MAMKRRLMIGLCLGALSLAGCGGGSTGSGVASTPTPTPSPLLPPPETVVSFLSDPATQQFATQNTGPGDLQVRYDGATNLYEVSVNGAEWEALRYNGQDRAATENLAFQMNTAGMPEGLQYSAFAEWIGPGGWGYTAFGTPTEATAMPTVGSATYVGVMIGTTDLPADRYSSWAGGSIQMAFEFSLGTLSGSIHPTVFWIDGSGFDSGMQDLGVIPFKDTVYSSGANSFSGAFDIADTGPNAFSGQFTGPTAEELIGKYAFPFTWVGDAYSSGDGKVHGARGVFVGER
jgi:hypothetical protein